MPNKTSTIHVCSNCDAQFSKWSGRCLECGGWGTLQIQTIDQKNVKSGGLKTAPAKIIDFENIAAGQASMRLKTNISEVDRVLGGGIMAGSLILLSGEPGIGKSTIVAQIAEATAGRKGADAPVIYVSGEESAEQVKERFSRLKCGAANIKFIGEINIEKILAATQEVKPALVIIDSIQTIYTSSLESESGSINQIRASAAKFLEAAKENNMAVILIGHITKDGAIAGPKSLEHIVDTVIYLETDNRGHYRILRAAKNRFGSINELGIFEMTGDGFQEIKNPAAIFLETGEKNLSGSVITSVMEGTRPFLIEVQALVTKTIFGYPQRKSSGFDLNRLQILAAVLTKRAKVNLNNQDIILNIIGGLKVNDPSMDLAVCLAITSSLLNQVVDRRTVVLGEVGLGGEIRSATKLEQKLAEAEKLGFVKAIVPDGKARGGKIKLKKVKNLAEAVSQLTQ